MTVKEMEKRVSALMAGYPTPPTFEQFTKQWFQMDELSKSLYVASAECPDLCMIDQNDEYWIAVSGYLERMGLVKEKYALADLMEGLEDDQG